MSLLTLTTAWCLGLALGFGLWLRLSIFSIFWLVIMVILLNVVVITFPVYTLFRATENAGPENEEPKQIKVG